ncbi:MAG: hypothetical protein ACFB2W_27600 [Leptolyngbyaceae cyanobacterium]
MLTFPALCLAGDFSLSVKVGEFWTPASIIGNVLIERLVKATGLLLKRADSVNFFIAVIISLTVCSTRQLVNPILFAFTSILTVISAISPRFWSQTAGKEVWATGT